MTATYCQLIRERLRNSDFYQQSVLATNVGVILAACAAGLTYGSVLITPSLIGLCLGFGLLFFHAPAMVRAACFPAMPEGLLWLSGVIIFTLTGLWCPDRVLPLCALVVSAGGYCLAAIRYLAAWNDPSKKMSLSTVAIISLMLAALFLGEAWGVYRNPLVVHALAVADTPHHLDPWFQSVLVATIQNYGTPSAGYDGINYLPYHHAVHFVLAAVAQFTGAPPIIVVSVGLPLMLMPSFIWAWGGLAASLGRIRAWSNRFNTGEALCIFWVITFIGLGQWLPMPIREQFFLWNNVFQSDSHAFGLIVCMALLSSAVDYCPSPSRKLSSPYSVLGLFLLTAVASFALTWSKVTIVHLMLGIAVVMSIRLHGRARICVLAATAGLFCGLVIATPLFLSALTNPALRIEFLGFWRAYLEPDSRMLYPVAAMFWGLAFCALYFRSSRIVSFDDLASGLRQRSLLPAEVVLGISILGITPGLLVGGSLSFNVMYYEETARLAAILATAALSVTMPMPVKFLRARDGSLAQVFAILLLAFGMALAIGNVAPNVTAAVKTNALYRGSEFAFPPGIDGDSSRPRISEVVRSGRPIQAAHLLVENLKYTEMLHLAPGSLLGELLRLQKLPRIEKQATLLFLPRTSAVWKIASTNNTQKAYVAMLPIGITGLALLDGTQNASQAEHSVHYAFGFYAPPEFTAITGYDNARLLNRATALGYSKVIILREDDKGHFWTETISAASLDSKFAPSSK